MHYIIIILGGMGRGEVQEHDISRERLSFDNDIILDQTDFFSFYFLFDTQLFSIKSEIVCQTRKEGALRV